jgi:anti-sigma factor RsiW
MVPEYYQELIHAELDDRLADQQRAELSRYLLENADARQLRDDLRRLNAALAQIEPVEPPAGLQESIVQAVRFRVPVNRPQPAWLSSAGFRYAAAFVGGALVTTLAFQIGLSHRSALDPADLTGTMTSPPHAATVPLQQGRGSATVRETASGLVLEYDLTAGDPVRIVTRVTGAPGADKSVARPQVELEVTPEGHWSSARRSDSGARALPTRRKVFWSGVTNFHVARR